MNCSQSGVALAVLLASGTAIAQASGASSPYDLRRGSWLPYATSSYIGLNLARPRYQLGCGGGCDQPGLAGHVYAGGMFSPFFGAELGYLNFGELERGAGSHTRAQGLNVSLVARASLGAGFGVFGRLGATYGRTRVDPGAGSGITPGRASGWGPAYGLGVDWQFSDNWSAVLDWQRHRFDLAGDDNGWVRATSVGLKYRF